MTLTTQTARRYVISAWVVEGADGVTTAYMKFSNGCIIKKIIKGDRFHAG